jgi:hypothetical protein
MTARFIHEHVATPVTVSWQWFNESEGLIEWTFKNSASEQKSVILLRSGYYFGNAFFPIYVNNPEFNTSFMTSVEPLANVNTDSNAPPESIVTFPNGESIACFVFTLAPNSEWSMLEGGWSSDFTPTNVALYEVTANPVAEWSVGYSPLQVAQWDSQTGTNYTGYEPNPKTMDIISWTCSGPYISLYNDPIKKVSGSQTSPCGEISGTLTIQKLIALLDCYLKELYKEMGL